MRTKYIHYFTREGEFIFSFFYFIYDTTSDLGRLFATPNRSYPLFLRHHIGFAKVPQTLVALSLIGIYLQILLLIILALFFCSLFQVFFVSFGRNTKPKNKLLFTKIFIMMLPFICKRIVFGGRNV